MEKGNKLPLPPIVKVAIGVGAGLLALAIFVVIKRNINNIKNAADSKKEVGEADATLKKLQQSGMKASQDGLKIQQSANSIFSGLNGSGTDEQSIYRAFTNINNDVDMINLIRAYGVRELNSGIALVPNYKGTLSQCLTNELDANEIKALNDLLARKGIKYRF